MYLQGWVGDGREVLSGWFLQRRGGVAGSFGKQAAQEALGFFLTRGVRSVAVL